MSSHNRQKHRKSPQQEQQKAVLNQLIHKLTTRCWEKCMGSPGKRLSSSEENCLKYCALRHIDASQFVQQRLQAQAQSGQI